MINSIQPRFLAFLWFRHCIQMFCFTYLVSYLLQIGGGKWSVAEAFLDEQRFSTAAAAAAATTTVSVTLAHAWQLIVVSRVAGSTRPKLWHPGRTARTREICGQLQGATNSPRLHADQCRLVNDDGDDNDDDDDTASLNLPERDRALVY